MRTLRWTIPIVLICAAVWAGLSCGEAATGMTPEQVWTNFEKNLAENNQIALPGLATQELTKRIIRDRMAFAGLANTIITASGPGRVEVLDASATAARLKVVYQGPAITPWTEEYVVLLEKPAKNWKVSKIEGNVTLNLPTF